MADSTDIHAMSDDELAARIHGGLRGAADTLRSMDMSRSADGLDQIRRMAVELAARLRKARPQTVRTIGRSLPGEG